MSLKHHGINRLGYVRFSLDDPELEKTRIFYKEKLGLMETHSSNTSLQLRCWHEPYAFTTMIEASRTPGLIEIGFQVRDMQDLKEISKKLTDNQIDFKTFSSNEVNGLGDSITFNVPHGPTLRLYSEMSQPGYYAGYDSPDWVTPKSIRGTPAPMFLNHVGVTSDNPEATVNFFKNILGFYVSEKMVTDNSGKLLSALLFRMSKNVGGQEIAIFPGYAGRLHHIAYTKDDASDILLDGQYLRNDGVNIEITGPTRQLYGNTFSLHFRDDFGVRLELCSGGRMTEAHPEFQPIVWTESNAARALAFYDDENLETNFMMHSL
jgi:catechol 2,3-dioxygenase